MIEECVYSMKEFDVDDDLIDAAIRVMLVQWQAERGSLTIYEYQQMKYKMRGGFMYSGNFKNFRVCGKR